LPGAQFSTFAALLLIGVHLWLSSFFSTSNRFAKMKDFDLDSELKALPVPDRAEEYWDAFPRRVLADVRSATSPVVRPRSSRSRLVPSFGWAFACVAFFLFVGLTGTARAVCVTILHDERNLRHTLQVLPQNMRTLMQDEHGLHYLVEDQS
jgi:hypothetical protein